MVAVSVGFVSESVRVVWDDSLTEYDFGVSHPLSPIRLDLTIRLARALGVLDGEHVELVSPAVADDALLATVHTPEMIAAMRRATVDPRHGLGTGDNPCFEAMHEASARVAAGSVAAALAVWQGRVSHAVNIAGGLHHAMPNTASGFCVYNDPALAIRALLDAGAERVAYVDVDVHHGDGVQAVFYDDPRVLTISLHETPRTLFPGTGYPDETGGPGAEGSAVNVTLPPGTTDGGWQGAFHAVVPPLLRSWRPKILVSQDGCDTHVEDPLARLALTVDGQRLLCSNALSCPRALRGPLAGDRRWRLRNRRRGSPGVDASAGGGCGLADPAGHRRARSMARPRGVDLRTLWTGANDRRPGAGLRRLGGRLRSGRLARPGHHGHPQSGIPLPRDQSGMVISLPHQSHAPLRCGHDVSKDRAADVTGTAWRSKR